MKHTLTLLLTTTALAVATPAIAEESYQSETKIERKDDGSFKKEVAAERKDASGKVTAEVETELDIEADGDSTKVVTTKDSKDPKGLFNKETVKTEQTVKVRDGKVSADSEKKVSSW